MLISVYDLRVLHGLRDVTGVLHLGAHFGEEADAYDKDMPWAGPARVHWVEANPDLVNALTIAVGSRPGHDITVAAVDSTERDAVLHVASNEGASSSLLELGTHSIEHPHITFVDDIAVRTTTVDALAAEHRWDHVNFVTLDLQGAELRALEGATALLSHTDYVFTEVNVDELYLGCPQLEQLDDFMWCHSFERVAVHLTEWNWGDAFYRRRG